MIAVWLLACRPEPEPAPVEDVHETLSQAEALAEHAVAGWPADDLFLGWIETVFAFGLTRLHAASGGEQWLGYGRDWLDAQATGPLAFHSSDSMSPALLASIVLREDPDAGLEPVLEAAEAYLASVPRTDEGAIVHWGEDTAFVDDDEVWIDSQFMVGMYLLSEHDRTGDRAYLDRFVEQYVLFSELCRDPAADLYRHAYDDGTDTNIPAEETFWARGNSWVLIAGAEALARLPSDDPAFEVVAPLFESHAASVLATQADDGLWHTVLNQPRGEDPANYTETSAAALFGYALVRGTASVLDPDEVREPLAALVAGLEERVVERDEALHVLGTSFGTNPGDYDYYVGIPQLDDQLLGYGSLLMFLAEVDGVPR